jgi:hypothetical protein
MSHQFSYPKVIEIRRVSLEVAAPAVLLAPAEARWAPAGARQPTRAHR